MATIPPGRGFRQGRQEARLGGNRRGNAPTMRWREASRVVGRGMVQESTLSPVALVDEGSPLPLDALVEFHLRFRLGERIVIRLELDRSVLPGRCACRGDHRRACRLADVREDRLYGPQVLVIDRLEAIKGKGRSGAIT